MDVAAAKMIGAGLACIALVGAGIGIGNVNDGGNNFPFIGDIDEISLYARALSAGDIQAIYNAGSAGKCQPSVAPFIVSEPTNLTVTVNGLATFSVVLFPAPFGPSNATTSPRATAKSMPCRTSIFP